MKKLKNRLLALHGGYSWPSRDEMDKREFRDVGIFSVGRGSTSSPVSSERPLEDLCAGRADCTQTCFLEQIKLRAITPTANNSERNKVF